jgi:hypothetical protein
VRAIIDHALHHGWDPAAVGGHHELQAGAGLEIPDFPVTDWRPEGGPRSKENLLPRLNPDCRAVMNYFVYSMMNGLLGYPLLESIDYRSVLIEEGSAAEQAIAIFCNVLELDIDGSPVNANEAEIRAAQYIRAYCDRTYEVDPPFEDWEIDRPWRKGKRLGPMP